MSTHNLRRYLDLLNEADLVPPNAEIALPSSGTFNNDQALAAALAQENRCAMCGTPKDQHAGLKHQFVAEPAAQGSGGITRIKQLQQELKAAGAALGATGAGRDGIDGDLGPLTRAAAAKYPAIAAKYRDVLGSESATPAATQANISQLNTALDTIEQILNKYKIKMSESRSVSKPDQMESWRSLMEAGPTAQQRQAYQDAIQRTIPTDPAATPTATPTSANPYVTRPGGSREAQAYQAQKAAQTAGAAPAQAMPYTQAAGKAGTMSKLWSGIKGIAGKAALPITAIYSIWDGYTQISALPADMPKDQYHAAVAKIVARLVNDYGLFWVGAILGAGTAGAISGPGALAGFVAGGAGGIAASYLLGDSVGAITDAIVDQMYGLGPKVNISPEDATVLDQNLKALQTLSRDPAIAAAITPEIRARLDRVVKSAAATIAADTPAAGKQSATPTSTPTSAVAVPDDLVKSMDDIEKILDKYTVKNNISESELRSFVLKNMHLLSESEQMAIRRDMMNEGPAGWIAKAASKLAPEVSAGLKAGWNARGADTAKAAAQAAKDSLGPTGTLSKLGGYVGNMVWDGTKWVAKTAAKTAAVLGGVGYGGYAVIRALFDSGKLSDDDKKEIEQFAKIRDKYDVSTLSPEVQQRLAAIDNKMAQLVQAGVDH